MLEFHHSNPNSKKVKSINKKDFSLIRKRNYDNNQINRFYEEYTI